VTERLVLVGGGEHARVVIEAALSRPDLWEVRGFVDPELCERTTECLGVRRIGGDDMIGGLLKEDPYLRFVLGVGSVGNSPRRRQIVQRLNGLGVTWASVIHANASISASARIGRGVVMLAGSVVNACADLGDHAVVNTGAIVEHDVSIGEFSQVAPRACVGGGASLGADCYIGLGACIRDHISVGAGAVIAMGAVVVANVEAGSLMLGVPARRSVGEQQ
jgi:acetyltransferase EpsM